ncbi:MAG: methionine synthase [Spirochaetes bacterium]|nr:methionine synthase [Spirochaetota bacterium]
MAASPIFLDFLNERPIVIFDGATGTEIQKRTLSDNDWGGHPGCNEVLNLHAPDIIRDIHRSYLAAGADVIETNTFGATAAQLSEYGMEAETRDIARAAARIAREAVEEVGNRHCFVAGSFGPGTKLPSLGHTDFDALYESYLPGARGLIEGGIDLFLLETCQDPLQIKACLCAIRDALSECGAALPVAASITVETAGTLLVGTDVQAAASIIAAMAVDIIGINCATGPDHMAPHVRELCRSFPGPVLVMPNAGLPKNVNGVLAYDLDPKSFAKDMLRFAEEFGATLLGGCCGTTPSHISALKQALSGIRPAARNPTSVPGVASLYRFQELRQEPPPFFIGERANTNGSREFREYLLEENWDGMVEIGKNQVRSGAHAVDLCVAYAGRDEVADLSRLVPQFALEVQLPLVIDSTNPRAIEEALKRYGGRAIINSINLEEGEDHTREICRLARRYGAAVIALTIDEEGMAKTAQKKVDVARRLQRTARAEGLAPSDIIFDPLTFTLGSGDETLRTAGIESIRGIEMIKREFPGALTIMGLSNISYGLNPRSRQVLNSVFLYRAIQAGLDLAIVNVSQILPVSRVGEADLQKAMDLIDNAGSEHPLLDFIKHFETRPGTGEPGPAQPKESLTPAERLRKLLIDGSRTGIEEPLSLLLENTDPSDIINDILVPAMKEVGVLFGSGKMQLPFVLQSAEVMKHSVDYLTPFMDKVESVKPQSIVLATVKGDVHDIGKNLADIILSNNGIRVHNLGIRVDIEEIVRTAREVSADAIGMSGLLVKSTQVMKENLEFMKENGLDIPVLLGGAALTRGYVVETCGSVLQSPVVYCEDAFSGLKAMNLLKEGRLAEFAAAEKTRYYSGRARVKPVTPENVEAVQPAPDIPAPPFRGSRIAESISPASLFGHLDERTLFRARWGFRRGSLSSGEFDSLIQREAVPALTDMKKRLLREAVLSPQVVYGYWPCVSRDESLLILDPSDSATIVGTFHFPRQKRPPRRSLADYFLKEGSETIDLIALQAVTLGPGLELIVNSLYERGEYRDYLFYHGLGVELAEALAEQWHGVIREEMGMGAAKRGLRYSFGYPPCPDLDDNRALLGLLGADRIGISLVENGVMVPELSTSAFIIHHPQARYFTID